MTVASDAAMRRAIELAAGVRASTSPNPWVGAVIEPGGYEGATEAPGKRHAEIVALEAAGENARGATLYTTLEPCSHHGRTPPCVDAIVAAGVARVVIGIEDRDPNVGGEGVRKLRAAGVQVDTGMCESEVREQLAPYIKHRTTGRPWVVLKLAATLDGRVAAPDHSSRWITGPEARADGHRLRAESDAVIVGAGTIRRDDPRLTVRDVPGSNPVRVVLGHAPPDARAQPVVEMQGDLETILDQLGEQGVVQAMVEGGPTVAGRFHNAGLVDRYVVYIAPAIFAGNDAVPMLWGAGARTIDDLWRGRFVAVERVGDDLRVEMAAR